MACRRVARRPAVWLFATGVFAVRRPAIDQLAPIVVNAVAAQLATLPVIAAGASLLARNGGGLYWLVPAIVLLLGVGVMSAWVLLIEIARSVPSAEGGTTTSTAAGPRRQQLGLQAAELGRRGLGAGAQGWILVLVDA
jgi:hypothetical protein